MFVKVLEGWIDETHRSLHQAKIKSELRADVDRRAAALELHRIVWSHGWTSVLYGHDASARSVIRTLWHRLSEIAAAPAITLPPLEEVLGSGPATEVADLRPAHLVEPRGRSAWSYLLEPDDPLFHAFVRHEVLGDERSFLNPPPVLPEDVAEAEAFRARTAKRVG